MKKRNENDPVRIQHMLDAAQAAVRFIVGKSRETLDEDMMLTFALGRAFSVIGEAASHVTNELRVQNSHIPWEDIIGMRNWMVHAYFDVDLDLVWETTTSDLPPLIEDLERLLTVLKSVDRA